MAGVIAGALKAAADYRWSVVTRRGVVRWWSRRPFGQDLEDELDVVHVKEVEVQGRRRLGAQRQLVLVLDEGDPAVVARARLATGELDSLRDTVADHIKRARRGTRRARGRSASKG